jgi:hypothetical protein
MAVPSDQELLDAYKTALLIVASGQSYTINGRTLTRQNLKEIRDTITWLEERIGDEDGSGGFVLARFNQPS